DDHRRADEHRVIDEIVDRKADRRDGERQQGELLADGHAGGCCFFRHAPLLAARSRLRPNTYSKVIEEEMTNRALSLAAETLKTAGSAPGKCCAARLLLTAFRALPLSACAPALSPARSLRGPIARKIGAKKRRAARYY